MPNEFLVFLFLVFVAALAWGVSYVVKRHRYMKARNEIFAFVESYKKRCNGHNRFVVTVETLQDSFREYDTDFIKQVWNELVREHIVEQDPMGGEWCVR